MVPSPAEVSVDLDLPEDVSLDIISDRIAIKRHISHSTVTAQSKSSHSTVKVQSQHSHTTSPVKASDRIASTTLFASNKANACMQDVDYHTAAGVAALG